MSKKGKALKSVTFPLVFLAFSVIAAILFRSFRATWVFIDTAVKIEGFTMILLSLMTLTAILLGILSALRIYETRAGNDACFNKKAYSVLLIIGAVGASAFLIFTIIYALGIVFTENLQIFSLNLKKSLTEAAPLIIIPSLLIFYPKLGKKAKYTVLSAGLVIAAISGINTFSPLSAYKITSVPMVIDNGKEYSIVFSTSDYGTAYVEYSFDGQDYKIFDQTGGRLNSDRKIHNIAVPYEHLRNNSYKVSSTRVIEEFSYGSRTGKTVTSDEYTFRYNNSENQTWLVISDWHTLLDEAYDAIGSFECDYDSVILLGDSSPGVDYEEQVITNTVQFGGEVSKGTKPVIYVRGNHETRGGYANDLPKALGLEQLYYTADIGPYSFVVLDSGEDKDDSHHEYGGMTDYNTYRADMIEWLKKVNVTNDKVIALSHSWKISDVEPELSEAGWAELDRLGTRLIISGHTHACRFIGEESDYEKEIFGKYPDIVGYMDGGKTEKDYIASLLTLKGDGFEIRAIDNNKNEIIKESFDW